VVIGIHYQQESPLRNLAGGAVFEHQRGDYETFSTFIDRYLSKFGQKGGDPRDKVDAIIEWPLFDSIAMDAPEPDAVNIILELNRTTLNFQSQGA
jgi:hypothetical protein